MYLLTLLLLFAIFMVHADQHCPENNFLNLDTNLCQKCSKCNNGQLLRRTCSVTNDTLCGLENFEFPDISSNQFGKTGMDVTPSVLSEEDEKYWKDLAIALIATLSMLVVVTTIIVLITCYRFRNTGWFCKHVVQDQDDLESGYVVIHKFMPDCTTVSPDSQMSAGSSAGSSAHSSPETQPFVSSQQQQRTSRYKPYRPKRRLMNEYVDDVFESDDSSGSRTIRLPLATIPERSEGS